MKSTLRNMCLSLGLLVTASAAILAGVKNLTDEPIAEAARKARLQAFTEVLGPFDNNPEDASSVLADGTTVYRATLGNVPAGAAVEITAPQGFSGPFSLMVGFAPDGSVKGYTVLAHSETPGLGAKMGAWFSDPSRPSRSIIGRTPDSGSPLAVSKDGGEVDAITGATITSRAFLQAINKAAEAYRKTQSPTAE